MHQVILSMLVTKDLDSKVVDHIDPWGEILTYIAWAIRASYHHNIMATPFRSVLGKDMIFNFKPVLDWQVVTTLKRQQMDIDNVQKKTLGKSRITMK